jgi:hypothetical protein
MEAGDERQQAQSGEGSPRAGEGFGSRNSLIWKHHAVTTPPAALNCVIADVLILQLSSKVFTV